MLEVTADAEMELLALCTDPRVTGLWFLRGIAVEVNEDCIELILLQCILQLLGRSSAAHHRADQRRWVSKDRVQLIKKERCKIMIPEEADCEGT